MCARKTPVKSPASSSPLTRRGLAGRIGIGLAVGIAVGELAALTLFAGAVDRSLDRSAARDAESMPAVTSATAELAGARRARASLDEAVDQARARRDDALVVARCEYHPTPACPQTRITGIPGAGPETRTAQDMLADTQRELDRAVAARDNRAAGRDTDVVTAEQVLAHARGSAVAAADRGIGARWVALNDYTRAHPGVLAARLALIGAFTLLTVLPLILARRRGETSRARRAAARTEVDRAERQAEVAIAVKRAEVRAATEMLWAEQRLTRARLTVQAQTAIDEAQQHRRVAEALGAPFPVAAARDPEPVEQADRPAGQSRPAALPAAPERLPAPVRADGADGADAADSGANTLVPAIPELARTAARWLRPVVPPVVSQVIDTTTRPMRNVQRVFGEVFEGVFEELEEITFTLKRTRRVDMHSVNTEERRAENRPQPRLAHRQVRRVSSERPQPLSAEPGRTQLSGPRELAGPQEPRELPPG